MITIIVPTLNEAQSVATLAARIAAALEGERFETIVVDDDSSDETWRLACELPGALHVRIIRRVGRSGLSSAVVEGFAAARGEIIGVIDADLSHPPETIPGMLHAIRLGGADLVIASRMISGGATEGWPRSRKFSSRIASLLAKPITTVRDPMSGFLLFRREVIEGVRLKPRGYKIGLEILIRGNAQRIVEVPFIFRDRTAGKSKLGVRQNIEYLLQLADLYLYKLRRAGWSRMSR
jgi:dolichol-phosphate mannosyltransferase